LKDKEYICNGIFKMAKQASILSSLLVKRLFEKG
jgi:hypothetical protein